ncbi:hypothetical protein [Pseudomonas sp. efr-133-TYG-23]|uniref:hypothetical protein n=1 Tax=Pseudomonas sp. efr-133-TYG-23 TaxID=3040309 RepID=UPI00255753B4|nr:hypothetical protein [Pseudomonas sp. efr-133-TYG-23]
MRNQKNANGEFSGTVSKNDAPTDFVGESFYLYYDDRELEIYAGDKVSENRWSSITLTLAPNIVAGKHVLDNFSSFRSAMVVPAELDSLQNYEGTLDITPDHTNRHYKGTLSLTAKSNGSDTYKIDATFDLQEST